MNRCETCAHWDRKYHIEPDQRLCLAKKLDSTEPDGARIAYVEKRHAMFLATSPQFGCVHHTSAGVPVDRAEPKAPSHADGPSAPTLEGGK
jgi:hypothetical protein